MSSGEAKSVGKCFLRREEDGEIVFGRVEFVTRWLEQGRSYRLVKFQSKWCWSAQGTFVVEIEVMERT